MKRENGWTTLAPAAPVTVIFLGLKLHIEAGALGRSSPLPRAY
jgi:hypothetical protein